MMGKKKQLKTLNNIAQRVFNTELYVEPHYGRTAINFLQSRMGLNGIEVADNSFVLEHDDGPQTRYIREKTEPMTWWQRDDGTAVVPVNGTLFHGSSYGGIWSSLGSGYKSIAANMQEALTSRPERVAMLIDSNGGEVNGCFACARALRDMADAAGIPVWAFSNESMYSAAYAIGSQADRVVLPDTGGVASVGVVTTHVDYSERMQELGVKVTFITSGDKKVVGNPYEALSDSDLAEIQGRIDKYANLFFELVSSTRNMSVEQIRSAQANIFIGSDATLDQGDFSFADEVMDIDDFYYAFSQEKNNTTVFTGDSMNKQQQAELQEKADMADSLQNDLDKSEAKNDSLRNEIAELKSENEKLSNDLEAANDRQTRYVDVMESEAAQGKQEKARKLLADPKFNAFNAEELQEHLADMSADKAEGKADDNDVPEPGSAAATVLAKARENDSDTKGIESRGEGDKQTDKAETGSDETHSAEQKDSRGRVKSESYKTDKNATADDHRAALKRSAAIVKQNRNRKHI